MALSIGLPALRGQEVSRPGEFRPGSRRRLGTLIAEVGNSYGDVINTKAVTLVPFGTTSNEQTITGGQARVLG